MTTHLDRLPVELLHMIFQFMFNCDVLWSFWNVSPYLNAVLNSHNWPTLNFKSIPKCHFDFICTHLDPQNIISLTLSDDLKSPGQIQLFSNRFNLRDFVYLRSLSLLSVTNEKIYPLLSDLPKLKFLTSLFTECRSSQPLLLGQTLNQLKSLQNLSVSQGDIFDHTVATPLHNLKVLNAGTCTFLQLDRLRMIVPSIVSLKITLQAKYQLRLSTHLEQWPSLEKLDLTLTGEVTTTFNEMEQFLSYLHNLTYLTLNIRGSVTDLADGHNWETCPSIIRLEKFDFFIEFEHPLVDQNQAIQQMFDSFSTPFWCHLRKWYVVVTAHNIYTISCFNDQVFIASTLPPLSTSSDDRWYYSNCKRIKMNKNTSLINFNRFRKLERLDLSEENILSSICNINQFSRLRHLIIHHTISNIILGNILKLNPYIDHLTLSQGDFNQLFSIENIHYLHLQDSIQIQNRTQIKDLCRIFPSLKRLFVYINSPKLICQMIDGLRHLENGIFYLHGITKPIPHECLKENTRLAHITCSFTCRNEPGRFLIWISNSVIPTIHLKDKTIESLNSVQEQRTDKCSLQ